MVYYASDDQPVSDHILDIPFCGQTGTILGMESWRDRARKAMKALKLSQDDLAERMEMTQGGIQHWLAGTRQPSLEEIDRIAALLQLPGAYLTHGVTQADLATGLSEPALGVIRQLIEGARSGRYDAAFFATLQSVMALRDSAQDVEIPAKAVESSFKPPPLPGSAAPAPAASPAPPAARRGSRPTATAADERR